MPKSKSINVLFLMSEPTNASRLRIGQELRDIREKIRMSKNRDSIELHQREAVRPPDLTQAIFDTSPTVIHFSGHGTKSGELCFEDENGLVKNLSPEQLEDIFRLFSRQVKCVFLNACYSDVQAQAIAKHIEYVIGMRQQVHDSAAILFATGFYKAVGGGAPIDEAYMFAAAELLWANIPHNHLPEPILFHRGVQVSPDETEQKILAKRVQGSIQALQRDKLKFLIIGRAGVGKSSTINSLMGEEVAETNRWESSTMSIVAYERDFHGVAFSVYDTPGLCDSDDESSKDVDFLKSLKDKIPELDCLLFVTPLTETRIRSDELRGIKLITQTLGKRVWENAVIVFTFSNQVTKDKFLEAVNKRSLALRNAMSRYIENDTALQIPCVPIDNLATTNPDGQAWLGNLYFKIFAQISDHGIMPFILATQTRKENIPLTDEQKESMSERLRKFFTLDNISIGAVIAFYLIAGILRAKDRFDASSKG